MAWPAAAGHSPANPLHLQRDNDVYLHCQTLDMERVTAQGYRFASVNISCNQPNKLMPLVEFVTGLAGLKAKDGMY